MNKSTVAYLIGKEYALNDFGVYEDVIAKKEIYCKISSVNGTEWFEGGRNGLNPQWRFTLFSHDYNGEQVIEHEGKEYTIYRTFYKSVDEIELYTELRKGNEQTNKS